MKLGQGFKFAKPLQGAVIKLKVSNALDGRGKDMTTFTSLNSNYCMIYGAMSGKQVKTDTKMV